MYSLLDREIWKSLTRADFPRKVQVDDDLQTIIYFLSIKNVGAITFCNIARGAMLKTRGYNLALEILL